jgi:hypothetical protein
MSHEDYNAVSVQNVQAVQPFRSVKPYSELISSPARRLYRDTDRPRSVIPKRSEESCIFSCLPKQDFSTAEFTPSEVERASK